MTQNRQIVKQQVPNFYDGLWEHPIPEATSDLSVFLNKVGLPKSWFKGKKVLDAGCGWGKNTITLSKLGAKVVAIDLCDLKPAKEYVKDDNVLFLKADLRKLPFQDNEFDFVICEGVLHHMDEYLTAFNQLYRVLKKKGVIVIGVFGRGGLLNFMWTVLRFCTPSFLKKLTIHLPKGYIIYDNLSVPIKHTFSEEYVRQWFPHNSAERRKWNYYDYTKFLNKIIHGEGWIVMKATK